MNNGTVPYILLLAALAAYTALNLQPSSNPRAGAKELVARSLGVAKGRVRVERRGGPTADAGEGYSLRAGDRLTTTPLGQGVILFSDGSRLELEGKTRVLVSPLGLSGAMAFLEEGRLRSVAAPRPGGPFRLATPTVESAWGVSFSAQVRADGATQVSADSGPVFVRSFHASSWTRRQVILNAGDSVALDVRGLGRVVKNGEEQPLAGADAAPRPRVISTRLP